MSKDRLSLLAIVESAGKIEKYTRNLADADEFYNDEQAFDASMMNFIIIGEMTTRLSEEFKEEHNSIDWNKIKAFRNIAAHNYFGIDAEEVWQIIKNRIPELKKSLIVILKKEFNEEL